MWVTKFCAIILLCVIAAIIYGIIHDQITARICVEYFTIGHPPVFGTNDPTLLGLGWGVIATWWVGLILGIPLALVSLVGSWPQFTARRLVRPLMIMLGIVGMLAIAAGMVGHVAASRGWVWLAGPLASRVPRDRHVAFLTDLWAHLASYIGGFVGGVVLCVWVAIRRRRMGRPTDGQRVDAAAAASQVRRHLPTILSLFLSAMVLAIWIRSLTVADLLAHSSPTSVEGRYARTDSEILSGYGFLSFTKAQMVPVDDASARWLDDLDRKSALGWSLNAVDGYELSWGGFAAGLGRIGFYSGQESRGRTTRSWQSFELPDWLLLVIVSIPAQIAQVRGIRAGRARRRAGFPVVQPPSK